MAVPVPGPPAAPRCPECDRVVSHQGHAPDCRRGQEQAARERIYQTVESGLVAQLRARRRDHEFIGRLHARIVTDAAILDRLAEDD